MRRSLVVGLGSHHGDDQAGWRIAELLAAQGDRGYQVRLARTPSEVLDCLAGTACDQLVLCDACEGAGEPGAVHRWRWPSDALPPNRCRTTHDLGLAETLALAGRLQRLPSEVCIWGIELAAAAPGDAGLSPAVAAAIELAAQSIHRELVEEAGHA